MKKWDRREDYLLQELLSLAFRLDIHIRKEALGDDEAPAKSGLAYVDGYPVIFLERSLPNTASVDVLVGALASFPLDGVYVKPAVRNLLENRKSQDHEYECSTR